MAQQNQRTESSMKAARGNKRGIIAIDQEVKKASVSATAARSSNIPMMR